MGLNCSSCGGQIGSHGGLRCLPTGRALILLGGLALVAAYFMPWFSVSGPQGSLLLSGEFLGRFLSGSRDLRQFVPGSSGNPSEVQALRALVYLFPISGVAAILLAGLAAFKPRLRRSVNIIIGLLGVVPVIALLVGLSRMPSGAGPQAGLWLIGAASVAISLGAVMDRLLARPARQRA